MAAVSVADVPSHLHEALVEMFRDRPSLAAELLAGPLGMDMTVFDRAAVSPGELTDIAPTAVRDFLEALMTTTAHPYQSDFARRYFDQGEAAGEARGEAKAVLAFLDARGIEVPDKVREQIATCTDIDQLDTWVRRAATARTVQDLFE